MAEDAAVNDDAKLNEFDKEEWWDVARHCRPGITRAEFDAMWADYHQRKEAGLIEGQHTLQ